MNLLRAALGVVVLLALDLPWVGLFMAPRYKAMVERIQGGVPMKADLRYAAISYALMATGLVLSWCPSSRRGPGM